MTAPEIVDVYALEKAELHCHVDGLLDGELLAMLHGAGELLGLDAARLRAVLPVTSPADWMARYGALVEPHLSPADRVLPLLIEHHLRRLERQNVVYVELFVSRLLSLRGSVEETVELFAELRDLVDRARGHRQRVVLVVCIGRGPRERIARQTERIVALARAGLVRGVALAGDEARCRVADVGDCLHRLRDEGLGIEIHAGEVGGAESVVDALEHGRPHRLGHAVAAFGEPRLVDRLIEDGIHVELCPTSNLRLGVVSRIEDHPLRVAHERGVSFSINTDDPGPFECSMSSEYALVQRAFGFGAGDFARVFRDTMAARFE